MIGFAAYKLGCFYHAGVCGFKSDNIRAIKWFNKAKELQKKSRKLSSHDMENIECYLNSISPDPNITLQSSSNGLQRGGHFGSSSAEIPFRSSDLTTSVSEINSIEGQRNNPNFIPDQIQTEKRVVSPHENHEDHDSMSAITTMSSLSAHTQETTRQSNSGNVSHPYPQQRDALSHNLQHQRSGAHHFGH